MQDLTDWQKGHVYNRSACRKGSIFLKDSHDLSRALAAGIDGDVRLDSLTRRLYATDASIYEIEPVGVVLPRSTEDVVHAVKVAGDRGLSLLPRGGATSLAGQTVGESLHIDFSRHMNRIIEVDVDGRTARVEPGVVLDELNHRRPASNRASLTTCRFHRVDEIIPRRVELPRRFVFRRHRFFINVGRRLDLAGNFVEPISQLARRRSRLRFRLFLCHHFPFQIVS